MGEKAKEIDTTRALNIREQIVQAGMRVFAKIPFGYATLHDVAVEAGQNITVVEQHFKTKEDLYRKVFGLAICSLRRETTPIYLEWKAKGSVSKKEAREALFQFVELFMTAANAHLSEKDAVIKIFLSEMLRPSSLYDEFFHGYFTESYSMLADVVMAATDSKDFDWAVYQLVAILGMITSFHMEREFLVRFLAIEGFSADETNYLKKMALANVEAILGITLPLSR